VDTLSIARGVVATDTETPTGYDIMPNISLTDQEKEILLLGQEFKKLKDSPAYQKTLEWLNQFVTEGHTSMADVLSSPVMGMDEVAKSTIIWNERRLLLAVLDGRVTAIINQAKKLAEDIAGEEQDGV
jgi:hypothetical protein